MNKFLEWEWRKFIVKHKIFRKGIPFLFMPKIKRFKVKDLDGWHKALEIEKLSLKYQQWLDKTVELFIEDAHHEIASPVNEEIFINAIEECIILICVSQGVKAEEKALNFFLKKGYQELQPHQVGETMYSAEKKGIDFYVMHPDVLKILAISVKPISFDTYRTPKASKTRLVKQMLKHNIAYLAIINLTKGQGQLYTAEQLIERWNLTIG